MAAAGHLVGVGVRVRVGLRLSVVEVWVRVRAVVSAQGWGLELEMNGIRPSGEGGGSESGLGLGSVAAAAHHAASTVALLVLELTATERSPTLRRVGVRRAELVGGAAPRAALRHRRVDASLWRQVKRHGACGGTIGPAVA
jgi:hypothetical protein